MVASANLLLRWLLLFLLCCLNSANVEKIVFVAPDAQPMPPDASIDNLLLMTLSGKTPAIRTFLNASFPTNEATKGTETWVLLKDLGPGQRYEVRVNWIATQPTSFWLYQHTMDSVFSTPDMLFSLTAYANARHESIEAAELEGIGQRAQYHQGPDSASTTFLFLQVYAKADYFTLNKTMMDNVPPVQVDIILDPYLLNVFPKSLVPTGGYLVAIAVAGWFISGWINKSLVRPLAASDGVSTRKKRR